MTADASELIDRRIEELGDWRGEALARVRRIIRAADPDVVEEWKWAKQTKPGHARLVARRRHLHRRGRPERRQADLLQGRLAPRPRGPLQREPRGQVRRAIDIGEGDALDEEALQELVRDAVALNLGT